MGSRAVLSRGPLIISCVERDGFGISGHITASATKDELIKARDIFGRSRSAFPVWEEAQDAGRAGVGGGGSGGVGGAWALALAAGCWLLLLLEAACVGDAGRGRPARRRRPAVCAMACVTPILDGVFYSTVLCCVPNIYKCLCMYSMCVPRPIVERPRGSAGGDETGKTGALDGRRTDGASDVIRRNELWRRLWSATARKGSKKKGPWPLAPLGRRQKIATIVKKTSRWPCEWLFCV